MNFSKFLNKLNNDLSNSQYTVGIAMLMLNIGSKYISMGLSKTQEAYLTTTLARQILIFSITFMGTRNLSKSLILTVIFVCFADYLFNENSKYCVIPKKLQKIYDHIDTNKDGVLSKEEINKVINILDKSKQNNLQN